MSGKAHSKKSVNPQKPKPVAEFDNRVEGGKPTDATSEPMKQFTIDVPVSLHIGVKSLYALQGKPKSAAGDDNWDEGGKLTEAPPEPMKRFTIDVPESLHARVKMGCAKRRVKMTDAVRELLEKEFPES